MDRWTLYLIEQNILIFSKTKWRSEAKHIVSTEQNTKTKSVVWTMNAAW